MIVSIDPERDWVRFGKLDPYFGVISDARLKSSAIDDEQRQLFFQGGAAHAGYVMDSMAALFGVDGGGRALDFGCGVGRITLGLAPFFKEVVGIDIAPGMLAEARSVALARTVPNVTFQHAAGGISPESFDFVHTFIVLQHMRADRAEQAIGQLVRATRINGVGASP